MHIKVLTSLYLHLFTSAFAYKLAIKTGWFVVLSFFVITHIGVSILAVSELYARRLPQLITDSRMAVIRTRDFIPNETQITWDAEEQKLSFEEESLPIRIPSNVYSDLPSFRANTITSMPKYAITVPQTETDLESDQLFSESLLTVTPSGIAVQGSSIADHSTIAFDSLPQFSESFTVNGEYMFSYITQTIDKLESTFYTYWPLFFILALPVTITFTLFNLLLDTFFIVLLVKLNKYSISISESIQLSILIGGIAALINQIAIILYPALNWPFYSITFWLIAAYVLIINKRLW